VQFIALPLAFLSTTFLESNLMPAWIRHLSGFNPTNWAVIGGRGASSAHPDWGLIASRAGFLALLLLACLAFATRAFRSYQRSV
jgi:ABC-2 type transport system permease protein